MYPRLREIREARKLTQKQVANYLRISQNTYSQYETGKLKLPTAVLLRLAELYRTSTDYLLGRTNER